MEKINSFKVSFMEERNLSIRKEDVGIGAFCVQKNYGLIMKYIKI